MKSKIPSLDALIKLLDDEDDIARIAILQLITHYQYELPEVLRQLQECDSVVLRKRSHQIQSLLIFRQRRMYLHHILKNHNRMFSISEALLAIHLMWYEKDQIIELIELYQKLLAAYPQNNSGSLHELVNFLKDRQFLGIHENATISELYMLGDVLEHTTGANSFMCALLLALNEDLRLGLKLDIINFEHKFYLYEPSSNSIVDILQYWNIRKKDFDGEKYFSRNQLLKFIGSVCFCHAIHNDAFRYVLILGEILAENHNISTLPYPYGPEKI